MSIAIDFPPAIERDVRCCADERGMSFVQFVKPNISDFLGYGLKFDPTPMTTAEYMAEMREGEESCIFRRRLGKIQVEMEKLDFAGRVAG